MRKSLSRAVTSHAPLSRKITQYTEQMIRLKHALVGAVPENACAGAPGVRVDVHAALLQRQLRPMVRPQPACVMKSALNPVHLGFSCMRPSGQNE